MTASRLCAYSAVLLLAGLLSVFAACDSKSPNQPAPLIPALARLELSGPRTLAPGQPVTFTATALYTTGAPRDVTAEARWQSDSPAVFRMEAAGRGTAGQRGDVNISAHFNGVTSVLQVVVVPEGTYRLSGVVRSNPAGEPVPGARVEVLEVREPVEATTDFQGRYVLFGVPGTARVRITREGYVGSEQAVQLTGHETMDFALVSRPLPDLTGTYILRITLATPCGEKDPGAEFRDRTYTATIAHSAPSSVDVRLTGADMAVRFGRGDHFKGTVHPAGASFSLDDDFYHYSYPEVVERLPNGIYLIIGGAVTTTKVANGLVGTMQGSMRFETSQPGPSAFLSGCWSQEIRFSLVQVTE
jgi:hypothetical protein